jgi:lipopolysaccharide export system permease protein
MIIRRYLFKEICLTLLATTSILLAIFVTNQFVLYLNDAAAGKFTIKVVMEVMSLQVPIFLGYLLPLGFFFSVLLVLGRLYADHEMVVLFSCGVSRWEILRIVMYTAVLIAGLVAWLMMVVEPKVEQYRSRIVTRAIMEASLDKIQPGRFQNLGGSDNTFYAEGISADHRTMHKVFWAHQLPFPPPSKQRALYFI